MKVTLLSGLLTIRTLVCVFFGVLWVMKTDQSLFRGKILGDWFFNLVKSGVDFSFLSLNEHQNV